MTPSASPQLDELLASPPGDGITVSRNDDQIEIHIRAASWKDRGLIGRGLVLGIPILSLIFMYIALQLLFVLDESNLHRAIGEQGVWWVSIALLILGGLGVYFSVFRNKTKNILSEGYQNLIRMDKEHLLICEVAVLVEEFRWEDIQCFRAMQMPEPGMQLYARLKDQWVEGRGDGIAVVTSEVIYKMLDLWHQDISEWVARVLSAYSGIELSEDASIEQRLRDYPIPDDPRYVLTRGVLRLVGIMLIGLGAFCIFAICMRNQDLRSVHRWKPVQGQIVSTEKLNNKLPAPPLKIIYEYEVEGVRYENDRYRIFNKFSQAGELNHSELNSGDPVEVWYHPDDPQRAALIVDVDRDSDLSAQIFLWTVSLASLMGGGGAIVFSFFRDEAKPPQFARGLAHPEGGLQE